MPTKAEYQKWIWTYKKRRDAWYKRCKKLSTQIEYWRSALRRIEYREKKLNEINEMVKEFTGVSVKNAGRPRLKAAVRARQLFYKYCLEHNLEGSVIAKYCGVKDRNTPGNQRKKFTTSFKTDQIAYNTWKQFVQFSKQRKYQAAA